MLFSILSKMSLPARNGKPWRDDEILQLLKGVQKKKTTEELAEEHQRTPGGIRSRLREIAADYYFNENRPLEQIAKFTGLDIDTISDAISKRQYRIDQQEKKIQANVNSTPVTSYFTQEVKEVEPKKGGMISLLTEIRDLMKEMVSLMKEERH
jgi:hypothetical protein